MKKIISLLITVVTVLSCINFITCGGREVETTTPSGEEETLGIILARGESIEAVKYDIIITSLGAPAFTQKIWVKHHKMIMEITDKGETVISLIDLDTHTGYAYMPEQNIAYEAVFNLTIQSASEAAQSIIDYGYKVVGTETVDSKSCLLVEYTDNEATVKQWIWKDYGFPIRTETKTSEGTIKEDYNNIEFSDIPDNMFELPSGVQIIEM